MRRGDIVSYVDPRGKVHHCLIRAWGGNPDRNLSLLELGDKSQPVEYSVGYERVTAAGQPYRGEVLLTVETALEIGERILAWLKSDEGKAWMKPAKVEITIDESRGQLEPYQIPTHLANKLGKMSAEMATYLNIWESRYRHALKRVGGRNSMRLDVWMAIHHEGFSKTEVAKGKAYARYYGPNHEDITIQIPPMEYKAVDSYERWAKKNITEYIGPQDELATEGMMASLEIKPTNRQDSRPVHLVTDVEADNARPGCYSCGVEFTKQNRSILPDVCKSCLSHDLAFGFVDE